MRRWIALAFGLLGCAATVPHEEGPPPRRPAPEVEKRTAPVPAASTPSKTEESLAKTEAQAPKADAPVDVGAWRKAEEQACGESWSTARGCKTPPAGASEEDASWCRVGCLRAADASSALALIAARDACIQRYLDSEGKDSLRCDFAVPGGADEKYRGMPALCLTQCGEWGKKRLAEARSKQPEEAPQPPAGGGGSGGDRVKCCDGTLSPTCTYGRPSLRGCCSRHGGVCLLRARCSEKPVGMGSWGRLPLQGFA